MTPLLGNLQSSLPPPTSPQSLMKIDFFSLCFQHHDPRAGLNLTVSSIFQRLQVMFFYWLLQPYFNFHLQFPHHYFVFIEIKFSYQLDKHCVLTQSHAIILLDA